MERRRKRLHAEMVEVDLCKPPEEKVMSGVMPQVLECILSYMPVVDVCRLSSVCREWKKVAVANRLWEHLCRRDEIDLQQLTQTQSDGSQTSQRLCYKSMYKEYALTLKKWTTGQGVTTDSTILKTPNGETFSGECLAISSHYIFARAQKIARQVHVFLAETGAYSHQLTGLHGPVRRLIVSKDETKAAAHCHCSMVCVWNLQSQECMHTFRHHAGIETMRMDGVMLAVGLYASPSVYLWSVESGQLLHQLQGDGVEKADGLVMDGQHLAVYDYKASILQLWDVNTGRKLITWPQSLSFYEIFLDANMKSVVARNWLENSVTIWDTGTGMLRANIRPTQPWQNVLAMMIKDHKVVMAWRNVDNNTGSIGVIDLRSCAGIVNSVNECPNFGSGHMKMVDVSNELILVVDRHTINVWNVRKGQFVRAISVRGPLTSGVTVNASLKQLQVVFRNENGTLTYETYDFGA